MSLQVALERVPAPRDNRGKRHPLTNILIIVVVGYFCNLKSISMMALMAKEWSGWYRKRFGMEKIPSRDTIRRALERTDESALVKAVCGWLSSFHSMRAAHIAIDGKCVRGASTTAEGGHPRYILNVYDILCRILVHQEAIDAKTNEMATVRSLLDRICLTGALVSMDAMGLEKNIVRKLSEQMAHFIISLKGNQESLEEYVRGLFDEESGLEAESCTFTEKGHGRVVTRTTRVLHLKDGIPGWPQIVCVASVHRDTHCIGTGENSVEDELYVSNCRMQAETFARNIVLGWGIEGGLHATLDGSAFQEDLSHSRKGNSMANLSLLRKLVFSMINLDPLPNAGRSMAEKMNIYRENRDRIAALLTMKKPFKVFAKAAA